MRTITCDTLEFVERLEKAGMPREQAAALAEVQKEVLLRRWIGGWQPKPTYVMCTTTW